MIDKDVIYNVDCINGMRDIDGNSIDLLVTSPPYFNVKNYSQWESYDEYLSWLVNVFSIAFQKLKVGRMCCVNISTIIVPRKSRRHESQRIPLPFHFVCLMERIGFKFLEDIIWEKPEGAAKNRNGCFFQHRQPVAYKPNVVTEYILVFQKPLGNLIDTIVREYRKTDNGKSCVAGEYERSNLWKINPETKSKHPAPFPEKLSDNLIQYYSYIGDTVLDIFMGSGTTAISSINNNRHFIGFELNNQYFVLANNRIKKRKEEMRKWKD